MEICKKKKKKKKNNHVYQNKEIHKYIISGLPGFTEHLLFHLLYLLMFMVEYTVPEIFAMHILQLFSKTVKSTRDFSLEYVNLRIAYL